MVLTTFLNELNSRPEGGILILEDYQVITSPQVHETMAYLLDHLPATLHLVIMSRSDPPLPLARLRAGGDLLELRAADLRFSQEETRAWMAGPPGCACWPSRYGIALPARRSNTSSLSSADERAQPLNGFPL
jgi:LuxR family maltose regulon positive regulatory protein